MDVVADEEQAAQRALGDELADLGGGRLVVLRPADELEQQLLAAGERHGEPAHEAEVDVVADLEAEVRGVEVEGLVLVEDGDGLDAD